MGASVSVPWGILHVPAPPVPHVPTFPRRAVAGAARELAVRAASPFSEPGAASWHVLLARRRVKCPRALFVLEVFTGCLFVFAKCKYRS